MRSDNSQHLVAAARKRATQTRRRAITALRRIADNPGAISFDSVASEAGVSRSWLQGFVNALYREGTPWEPAPARQEGRAG